MVDQLNLKQFNRIYEETYNQVLKYIVCKCSNMEDINDIIYETYLEVYNAIVKKKKIEDVHKYIIGIAKNKINKYYTFVYRLQNVSTFKNKDDEIELLDNVKSDIDIEQIIIKTNDIEKIWNYLKIKKIVIQKVSYLYYELTDRVIVHSEKCKCGKNTHWLEIEGRTDDILEFENGIMIAPMSFYKILEEIEGITRFQLIQRSNKKTRIKTYFR